MCVCCCGKGVAQGWTEMSTSYKKSLQPRKLTLTHTQPLWREATASAIVVPTFSCQQYYMEECMQQRQTVDVDVYVVGMYLPTNYQILEKRRLLRIRPLVASSHDDVEVHHYYCNVQWHFMWMDTLLEVLYIHMYAVATRGCSLRSLHFFQILSKYQQAQQ